MEMVISINLSFQSNSNGIIKDPDKKSERLLLKHGEMEAERENKVDIRDIHEFENIERHKKWRSCEEKKYKESNKQKKVKQCERNRR